MGPLSIRRGHLNQEARIRRRLTALALTTTALALPVDASAHEPGRAECRAYQHMHAFVTGSPERGRLAGKACRRAANVHVNTHPLPNSQVPDILEAIRECESGGSYTAENPTSTASGAYQFLDTTWGGHAGYARASHAPPRIQDRKAIRHWSLYGTSPWAASRGCWG